MSKPKLYYFNAPVSRGEECRLALHLAGIDFEAARHEGMMQRVEDLHDAVRDHAGVRSWYAKS